MIEGQDIVDAPENPEEQQTVVPNSPVLAEMGLDAPLPEPYIQIKFQEGPIAENGVNGCQIEDVLDALILRLRNFQLGPFKCRENAVAITKMQEAKFWLDERTRLRKHQGVEGLNLPHRS